MDNKALKERAIKRGLATWQPLDPIDLTVNELANQEEVINVLGRDSIKQGLTAVEEAANFETGIRDTLFDLDMLGLEQDQEIARQRFLTEKQVLALKVAGDFLLLAAREYDAQVQGIIMDAREYAALIDREGIELQKQRALMDIKKEEAHLEEVQARILLEMVERRNQEIELAKARVEVARANVRVILADIQAQEAEVRVIRAQLEVVKAEADKAELIADVAQIMADIVVRGLARIRLAVETAEIDAAFTYIDQRLADLLAISEEKLDTEILRVAYEKLLNAEVALLQEAQEKNIDLETVRMAMAERLQSYEHLKQVLADSCARTRKDAEEAKKEALAKVKSNAEVALMIIKEWGTKLINEAQAFASQSQEIIDYHIRHYSQKIIKGFYSIVGSVGGGAVSSELSSPPATPIADVSAGDQKCSYEEPYL